MKGANTRFAKAGLTASSQRYLKRQSSDPYVKAAKAEGYRSRAAFKLKHIQTKFPLIKAGYTVIDLGAAPGGWSQICTEIMRGHGKIFALDLLWFPPIAGVITMKADFTTAEAHTKLAAAGYKGPADVVLSDMAPNTLGVAAADHLAQMVLAEAAADFALVNLKLGGSFLCKIFQGGEEVGLRERLRPHFTKVQVLKPPSSRKESREIFLLATGFTGA
jgi:23S rRNA (uridine2552-2'-O)-methyltransferase